MRKIVGRPNWLVEILMFTSITHVGVLVLFQFTTFQKMSDAVSKEYWQSDFALSSIVDASLSRALCPFVVNQTSPKHMLIILLN